MYGLMAGSGSRVMMTSVVGDDGDDDVGFGSRWGLGGKGEKMGFGDVEKKGLLLWKSSLVQSTFSVSRVYYARLSIAYVAFFLFF